MVIIEMKPVGFSLRFPSALASKATNRVPIAKIAGQGWPSDYAWMS